MSSLPCLISVTANSDGGDARRRCTATTATMPRCCTRSRWSSSMLSSTRANRSGLSSTVRAPSCKASRSRSSRVLTSRLAACRQAGFERGEAALQVGLHRVAGHAERRGDVVDAELVVVAQHEAGALPGGRSRSASSTWRWSSRTSISSSTPACTSIERRAVAQRHEAAPVVVAGQVEHDRAQVGGRPGAILDAPGAAGETDERLLHEVLGGVAIVDEQPGEAHQRHAFGPEHVGDEPVDVERRYRHRP